MANQSLALEFDEHSQRFSNRSLRWAFEPSYPKIDNIETFNAEISQVVMNPIDELLTRKSGNPRFVGAAPRANFRDNHQFLRVRMQRATDDLIGNMRSVENHWCRYGSCQR